MRKHAEHTLAATVLTRTGQVRDSSNAKMPALAAVSPKRESGPWKLCPARERQLSTRRSPAKTTHRAAPSPA
jgi:hypothetical protein